MSVRCLLPGLLLSLAAVSCSRTPSDVREWSASDHDNTENPGANQGAVSDGGQMGIMGVDEVALAAWRANCTSCHGVVGRGDGPRGPEKKARNLTDPAWQASVTDEQIAASIRNGKGNNMPAADLPEATVTSLVRLIRLLNADRSKLQGDAGAATDSGTEDAGAATKKAGARPTAPTPAPPKQPAPPPPAGSGAAP
jgi:mono/diheme cytochrome c family protein